MDFRGREIGHLGVADSFGAHGAEAAVEAAGGLEDIDQTDN